MLQGHLIYYSPGKTKKKLVKHSLLYCGMHMCNEDSFLLFVLIFGIDLEKQIEK